MPGTTTVLHVDDQPDVLDLSTHLFERQASHFSVTTAESGSDGMAILTDHDVDCIVSDSIRMPDGETFVEAASRETDAPIVLFTAKEWSEVADDAIAANVAEYVRKADSADYEAVVRHVLHLTDTDGDVATNRRLVGQHDFRSGVELGVSVVEAVEHVLDEDADTFEPLYESIDPDALESLLEPTTRRRNTAQTEIRFSYQGLDLAVNGDGDITVRSSAN